MKPIPYDNRFFPRQLVVVYTRPVRDAEIHLCFQKDSIFIRLPLWIMERTTNGSSVFFYKVAFEEYCRHLSGGVWFLDDEECDTIQKATLVPNLRLPVEPAASSIHWYQSCYLTAWFFTNGHMFCARYVGDGIVRGCMITDPPIHVRWTGNAHVIIEYDVRGAMIQQIHAGCYFVPLFPGMTIYQRSHYGLLTQWFDSICVEFTFANTETSRHFSFVYSAPNLMHRSLLPAINVPIEFVSSWKRYEEVPGRFLRVVVPRDAQLKHLPNWLKQLPEDDHRVVLACRAQLQSTWTREVRTYLLSYWYLVTRVPKELVFLILAFSAPQIDDIVVW